MKARLFRSFLIAAIATFSWAVYIMVYQPMDIIVEQKLGHSSYPVLYFSAKPNDFSEIHTLKQWGPAGVWQEHRLRLSPSQQWDTFRWDPATRSTSIEIKQIRFKTRFREWSVSGEDLASFLITNEELQEGEPLKGDVIGWQATGADPQFNFEISASDIYAMPVDRVAFSVLTVLLFSFVIWLAFESVLFFILKHKVKITFHFSEVASRLGGIILARPGYVIFLMGSVALPVLFALQWESARVTPIFQGPDEEKHAIVALHRMAEFGVGWEQTGRETWVPVNELVEDIVGGIRFRAHVKVDEITLSKLEALEKDFLLKEIDGSSAPAVSYGGAPPNIFNSVLYNLVAYPMSVSRGFSISPLEYFHWLRLGQVTTNVVLYGLLLWPVARGRFALTGIVDINPAPVRVGVAFAILTYAFIPQNIFMASVVNQEAYQVPLAITLVVSMVFRSWFVIPLLLVTAFHAFFPRRAVYLVLGLLLVFWHSVLAVYKRWRKESVFWWAALFILAGIVITPAVFLWAIENRGVLPFRVPRSLRLTESPLSFYWEIWELFRVSALLGAYGWLAFFGNFGWLDTPMPEFAGPVYRLLPATALLIGLTYWFFGQRQRLRFGWRWSTKITGLFVLGTLCIPLSISVIAYTPLELYYVSYGQVWWRAVQGRYMLPIFFYGFAMFYVVGAILMAVRSDSTMRQQRWIGGWVITLSIFTVILVTLNGWIMHSRLVERFYISSEVLKQYQMLLP